MQNAEKEGNRMKRIITVLLATAMTLSLVACAAGTAPAPAAGNAPAETTAAAEEPEAAEPADSSDADSEEYPVIRVNYHCIFETWEAVDEVQAALNELLREKAHAELEIVIIPTSDLKQQTNLLMTGGDDSLDILFSGSYSTVGELVSNGQVIALDDLLESDGQGILEQFKGSEYALDCGKVDGKIYALPAIAAWSVCNNYTMFEEVAQKAGVEFPEHVDTMDEWTDLMVQCKKANPDEYFIGGNNNLPWFSKDVDNLADNNMLGVLLDPANDTTVSNYFESDYFLHVLDNVKVWLENDLIYPDSYVTVAARSPLRTRVVCGVPFYSGNTKSDVYQSNVGQTYGANLVGVDIGDKLMTTGTVCRDPWHITSFCKNPEAAMRILNCLYTDPEVATLFMDGVEGSQYVVDENGQLNWPEGKSSQQDVGWMSMYNSTHPNGFLTPTWYNMLPDTYELMKADNASAKRSLALGFTVNIEPVADQYAACANVVAKYYNALLLGAVDIDETLPIFQKELHDNGIDEIIAEKQRQLDEWLQSK